MKQTAASELPAKHKNASHPSGWLVFFIFEFLRLGIQFFTCLFINPPSFASQNPPPFQRRPTKQQPIAWAPLAKELPVGLRIDNVIK